LAILSRWNTVYRFGFFYCGCSKRGIEPSKSIADVKVQEYAELYAEYDRLTLELKKTYADKAALDADYQDKFSKYQLLTQQLEDVKSKMTSTETTVAVQEAFRQVLTQATAIQPEAKIPEPSPREDSYIGTVGDLKVTFNLRWYPSKMVDGNYVYQNDGRRYELRGSNDKEGNLRLTELSGSVKTATLELSKSIKDDMITWSGLMNNNDGRRIPVRVSRKAQAQ